VEKLEMDLDQLKMSIVVKAFEKCLKTKKNETYEQSLTNQDKVSNSNIKMIIFQILDNLTLEEDHYFLFVCVDLMQLVNRKENCI
jgi:hypothetical protein